MEYMALWFVLVIILLITWTTNGFCFWHKAVITLYYCAFSYVFITQLKEIRRQFYALPVPTAYWDAKSQWVSISMGFYFLPFLLILLFNYYRWLRQTRGTAKKVGVAFTMVPAGIVFFGLMVIFGMYGYRP